MNETAVEMANCYESGMSLNQIAEGFRSTFSSVKRSLLRVGCHLRTQNEGKSLARGRLSAARLAWADKNAKGTYVTSQGYAKYTRGPHAGKFVHRVVMEEKLGRALMPDEVVHHIDRNRLNNDADNLIVLSPPEHAHLHLPERQREANGRLAKAVPQ